jgi:hypothetical protein
VRYAAKFNSEIVMSLTDATENQCCITGTARGQSLVRCP